MMEVFINELSFHEQLYGIADFTMAARVFYSTFTELYRKQVEHRLYWDENLFYVYKGVRDQVFISSLNQLSDKSFRDALIDILMNRLNARDWRSEQQHSAQDLFHWNEEIVTNTCLAELAERQLQNVRLLGLLINFPGSRFGGVSALMVIKNRNAENPIGLDCVGNRESLLDWLERRLQLSLFEYDHDSTEPPIDTQTVLREQSRFRKTRYTVQGRRVFQESGTSFFWYVDNLHYGNAAHLEVFSAQGDHIGEATLDGEINSATADRTKRLDFR